MHVFIATNDESNNASILMGHYKQRRNAQPLTFRAVAPVLLGGKINAHTNTNNIDMSNNIRTSVNDNFNNNTNANNIQIDTKSVSFRACYTSLLHILDGCSSMELRGLDYLNERLNGYQCTLNERIHTMINQAMDEKRNLISFTLTIITTTLAPLTIFTGYWGMNFDNMV